jgi:hypothetical protein
MPWAFLVGLSTLTHHMWWYVPVRKVWAHHDSFGPVAVAAPAKLRPGRRETPPGKGALMDEPVEHATAAKSATKDGPVEQATAAPGERRNVAYARRCWMRIGTSWLRCQLPLGHAGECDDMGVEGE